MVSDYGLRADIDNDTDIDIDNFFFCFFVRHRLTFVFIDPLIWFMGILMHEVVSIMVPILAFSVQKLTIKTNCR